MSVIQWLGSCVFRVYFCFNELGQCCLFVAGGNHSLAGRYQPDRFNLCACQDDTGPTSMLASSYDMCSVINTCIHIYIYVCIICVYIYAQYNYNPIHLILNMP